MANHREVLRLYYEAEKRRGGPHLIKEAISDVASENPPLTYEQVREIVIQDQIKGA